MTLVHGDELLKWLRMQNYGVPEVFPSHSNEKVNYLPRLTVSQMSIICKLSFHSKKRFPLIQLLLSGGDYNEMNNDYLRTLVSFYISTTSSYISQLTIITTKQKRTSSFERMGLSSDCIGIDFGTSASASLRLS